MKKVVIRFSILIVLTITGGFLYSDTPVSAGLTCADQVYNRWMGCDNAYMNTSSQYAIRENYCILNAPATCPPADESICETQASACGSDTTCYNSTYNNCCIAKSRAACEATLTTAYDNRGSTYSSCMGFEGNLGNCIEEIADFCLEAQNRASVCNAIYAGIDNWDARSTCLANSGVDQCL